jgi:hypothetical protein
VPVAHVMLNPDHPFTSELQSSLVRYDQRDWNDLQYRAHPDWFVVLHVAARTGENGSTQAWNAESWDIR